MKKIQLTTGDYTLVDDEDYESLNSVRWGKQISHSSCYIQYGNHSTCKYYAVTTSKPSIRMSRLLLGLKNKYIYADHINGDSLDNTRRNLRETTPKQNTQNKSAAFSSKTGIRGVFPRGKRFQAQVGYNGRKVHVGFFDTIEEANTAVIEARNRIFSHNVELTAS